MTRYESPGVVPPRANASSAVRTCRASRSVSAYTATLVSPASLQARATRTAISPRLAIRTFCTFVLPRQLWWTPARSTLPELRDLDPEPRQLGAQQGQGQPDDRRRVALDA